MSSERLKQAGISENIRPIDPNVKQWAASDPSQHVWVSASAGTGKTKVLTDRVLRLLLPRENGALGTLPHRILCLTYTKAAASEMTLRINKRLGEWVVMSEAELAESLKKTTGKSPTDEMMSAARQLFAKVVDTPGGLKIMTIHAFCQSILGRFPLEAQVLPQMEVLDEGSAQEMLLDSLRFVIQQEEARAAFSRLSIEMAESSLIDRIKDVIRDVDELENFISENPDAGAQRNALRQTFEAPDGTAEEQIECFIAHLNIAELKQFAGALASGSKTDQERGDILYEWLSKTDEDKSAHYHQFKSVFLTTEDKPRSRLSKDTKAAWINAEEFHFQICDLILQVEDKVKAIILSELTYDLLFLSAQVMKKYVQQKEARGQLDYNDLILKTYHLLQYAQNAVPWILYKLDGGLDHILVDEAQDTNPIQWKIIALLTEEFFVQQNNGVPARTLFVVGDEKQSIYRFQGAALEEFQYRRFDFSSKAVAGTTPWHDESLQTSFRSTRSVLEFVDAAFKGDVMRRDIGVPDTEELEHISWRRKQAGKVTLWPLIEPQKKEKITPWELPVEIKDVQTPKAQLAEKIAAQISDWISSKRELPSKGRPIQPGDIMVLVRSRDAFVENLIRCLKSRFVPVSGADRLILNHHIAVQDLLSLAKFALQPNDDLALAEILKSPFVGLEDQELEDLAYGRSGSLWAEVRKSKEGSVIQWLEFVQQKVIESAFTFFFDILNRPCPKSNVSGLKAMQLRLGKDCLDVLDEFLSSVQQYQYDHSKMLQSFMVWQAANPIEIKREFDGHENAVKIMTVHGAKGLQAPIVFLPDTLRTSSAVQGKIPRLLMPRRSEAATPIWSPRKAADSSAYTKYFDKIAAQEIAEYKRLFYVAATRAEDELVICGASPRTSADDDSWYYYAAQGFENLAACGVENEDGALTFHYPQSGDPEKDDKGRNLVKDVPDLPEWISQKAPEEPEPARPLRPSRPSEDEPAVLSPRHDEGLKRFRRGLLTHTLLQFLPGLPSAQWEEAGQTYLQAQAKDFSAEVQENILEEVLRVMQESSFAEIFSPEAQAEVSVTGHLPSGRLMSGQIDRLLIKEKEVLVIDYKTNRPQPIDVTDVPKVYRDQMRAYKEALEKIYPDKKIRCALLWTYGPLFMELEEL